MPLSRGGSSTTWSRIAPRNADRNRNYAAGGLAWQLVVKSTAGREADTMAQPDDVLWKTVSDAVDDYLNHGYDLRSATAILLGSIMGKYEILNNPRGANAIREAHETFMDGMSK